MSNHQTYHPPGLTLIEILIGVALGTIILSIVGIVSFDYLKSYQYKKEEEALVALLQKPRSRSINNINDARHGLHINTTSSPPTYTIYQGSYPSSVDEVYNYSDSIVIGTDSAAPCNLVASIDVVFEKLMVALAVLATMLSASAVVAYVSQSMTMDTELYQDGLYDTTAALESARVELTNNLNYPLSPQKCYAPFPTGISYCLDPISDCATGITAKNSWTAGNR